MEQLGLNWTDLHEIVYLCIFEKSVEKLQASLNRTRITGILHGDQIRFGSYLAQFLE